MMLDAYGHRLFVVVWAVIETSFFGGLMYGWGSLVYVLKEDGIYSFLCDQNSSIIREQSNPYQHLHNLHFIQHPHFSVLTSMTDSILKTQTEEKQRDGKTLTNTTSFPDLTDIMSVGYNSSEKNDTFNENNDDYNISTTGGSRAFKGLTGDSDSLSLDEYGAFNDTQGTENGISNEFNNTGELEMSAGKPMFPHCAIQDSTIAFGQTVAASCAFIGYLCLVHFHRKQGTKKLRFIIWCCFLTGCLCFAFVTNDAPWLIFLAYWIFNICGIFMLTTNLQIANLFTSASGLVISLICGGFDFTGSVLLFVKLAYENGISLMVSFLVLAVVNVMTLISAICWLPWTIFTKVDEQELTIQQPQEKILSTNAADDTHLIPKEVSPSLMTSLTSPFYMLHVVWYIIHTIRFTYFVNLFNPLLEQLTHNDQHLVSYFTDVFLYTSMFGFVTSFMAGTIYDWQKAKCKDCAPLKRCVMPTVLPLALTSLASVLVSILILVPNLNVLYFIFPLQTTYRSILYSIAATYVSKLFPAEHFSALYIIMLIFGGLFSFVLYALYFWSNAYIGAPQHVYSVLLCLAVASFLHPAYLVYRCHRETAPTTSTDYVELNDSLED